MMETRLMWSNLLERERMTNAIVAGGLRQLDKGNERLVLAGIIRDLCQALAETTREAVQSKMREMPE